MPYLFEQRLPKARQKGNVVSFRNTVLTEYHAVAAVYIFAPSLSDTGGIVQVGRK